MKTINLLTLLIIISSISFAQTNKNYEEIPDSISLVFIQDVNKWMDAYNSGDAKNLLPLYSENSEYISSHVNGLVAKGRDRLIDYFQNGINMGGHIDAIEILSIEYSCDLATLLCRYEATNSGQKAIGRNLLVLKMIDGVWLIVTHMTVV